MSVLRYLLALAFVAGTVGAVKAEPKYNYCDDECVDCSNYTCKTTAKCVPNKKECFEVECKQICVPAIRFPWQKACDPVGCGFVVNHKVLKKSEKECGQKMEYKHEVVEVPCAPACATGCAPAHHHHHR